MKNILCLLGGAIFGIVALTGTAPPAPAGAGRPMPVAFQGTWLKMPPRCNGGGEFYHVDLLTISALAIEGGETVSQVTAVRQISPTRIGVDETMSSVGADPESWSAATLYTLSARGQRLAVQQTRADGARLPAQPVIQYRRCG